MVSRSSRQYERASRGLEVIPFEPPKRAKMLSNYLVPYTVGTRSGATYSSSFAVYIYDSGGKHFYLVKEPYVNPEVRAAVSSAVASLSTWLAPSPIVEFDPIGYLFAEMGRLGILKGITDDDAQAAAHFLVRDILGYWILDPLIRDPEIEDISCEGASRPVKVWHRRVNSDGWLETNVCFADPESMDSIVSRLVHRSGRSISAFSPIVDSVLPEGFRLAATWGREVTSMGSSLTIRKHRAEPFSLSELIRGGALAPELAAYLWLLLDLKGFVMVSGPTASGKTTLLNALASVLNPAWKVVSIEDTREINLPQAGWKPLHTRTLHGGASITLFDLVKLSLRERPDFVILGEARGQEVQALFQSAAAGSGCITTFHSPDAASMAARLTQPPLSVSPSLLQLIDAAVFMAREPDGSGRSVNRVVEMCNGPEPIFSKSGGVWEGSAGESRALAARGAASGYSGRRISSELRRRSDFLSDLVGRGVIGSQLPRELTLFYASPSFTL